MQTINSATRRGGQQRLPPWLPLAGATHSFISVCELDDLPRDEPQAKSWALSCTAPMYSCIHTVKHTCTLVMASLAEFVFGVKLNGLRRLGGTLAHRGQRKATGRLA